jgi:hypothetical protein
VIDDDDNDDDYYYYDDAIQSRKGSNKIKFQR